MRILKIVLQILLAAFFVSAGVSHFTNAPFFLKIMPNYIPLELHWPAVLVSGVLEILLGVLLLIPPTKRWAAWGLIGLLIAVFPANIHVYQHQEIFQNVSPALHLLRLPLQGVLIAWAYWYTRAKPAPAAARLQRL